jgi:predicted GNAT family N-acyltransferase
MTQPMMRIADRVDAGVVGIENLSICLAIRRAVFIEGQGVPEDIEIDGLDPECTHLLAWLDGTPIATARMRAVEGAAKAERVAVLPDFRGEGIGRIVMDALEAQALAEGLHTVVLNAQTAVVPFYERLGYTVTGGSFLEAGIPHVPMRKALRER